MTIQQQHTDKQDFEKIYSLLRQKEQRVYSDEEVAMLPFISPAHIHYKEWLLRKKSSERLVSYLARNKKALDILEVGCGNGWLSKTLSMIPGSKVIGTDINFSEIRQAANVFQNIPNLHFLYTDAAITVFNEKEFDIIVFAASIQYFESLPQIIDNYLPLLKPGGEIHIIDSPFYSLTELKAAQLRTQQYYRSAGFPEMADRYFHHCYDDLSNYNYTKHYDPEFLLAKFMRNKNPFPWISIKATTP